MLAVTGFLLRTTRTAPGLPGVRLAGPRAAHPDIVFPMCPGCGFATSPVFRVDFRAEPFDALGLWPDELVTLICHNRCEPAVAGDCRWWDHRDPQRPVELDAAAIASERAPQDVEFEEVAVTIAPRFIRDPVTIELASCVGGEPAWLQRGYAMDDDGTVTAHDPDPPACPRCAAPTALLVQWSEAGMDAVPCRVTRAAHGWRHHDDYVMGNPFVRFWFGCAPCRLVGSLSQLD